jgi:hypothetical protein
MRDLHGEALKRIIGDVDGLESRRMFPEPGEGAGATITISVAPGHAEPDGDEVSENETESENEYPEGHSIALCKGGCAMHKGGYVDPESEGDEELGLPPFLRKKKGI